MQTFRYARSRRTSPHHNIDSRRAFPAVGADVPVRSAYFQFINRFTETTSQRDWRERAPSLPCIGRERKWHGYSEGARRSLEPSKLVFRYKNAATKEPWTSDTTTILFSSTKVCFSQWKIILALQALCSLILARALQETRREVRGQKGE